MRLTIALEGNGEGRVLSSLEMEEIAKMTITDDIEKSNFNPQMLKACQDTAYQCGYEKGREDAEKELQEQIPKWHLVADGDLPKENEIVLCVEKDTHIYYLGWYEKFEDEDFSRWSDTECFSMDVIAWMELPKFKGEE